MRKCELCGILTQGYRLCGVCFKEQVYNNIPSSTRYLDRFEDNQEWEADRYETTPFDNIHKMDFPL